MCRLAIGLDSNINRNPETVSLQVGRVSGVGWRIGGFIRRQDGRVRREVGNCQPSIGERGQGVRLVWLAFGIVNRTFGYGRFYYQPFRLICPLFRLNRTDSKTGGELTEGNA